MRVFKMPWMPSATCSCKLSSQFGATLSNIFIKSTKYLADHPTPNRSWPTLISAYHLELAIPRKYCNNIAPTTYNFQIFHLCHGLNIEKIYEPYEGRPYASPFALHEIDRALGIYRQQVVMKNGPEAEWFKSRLIVWQV